MVTIGPLPSSGLPKRIDDPAEDRVPDRHAQQPPGAADFIALLNPRIIAEDDDPDGILFQVEGQSEDVVGKLDHFPGHYAGESVDPRDAVADLQDAAHLANVDAGLVLLNLLPENGSDLVGFESHGHSCQ